MFFKEYMAGDNEQLQTGHLDLETYSLIHQNVPIVCVDILIKYKEGYLLIKRKTQPAKDEYWAIGGRIYRGISIEDNLKTKAKSEVNLNIENIKFLGLGRHLFATDPFNHHRGTDTPTLMFLAQGMGELKLDDNHSDYLIITAGNYPALKNTFHPYIRDYLALSLVSTNL